MSGVLELRKAQVSMSKTLRCPSDKTYLSTKTWAESSSFKYGFWSLVKGFLSPTDLSKGLASSLTRAKNCHRTIDQFFNPGDVMEHLFGQVLTFGDAG